MNFVCKRMLIKITFANSKKNQNNNKNKTHISWTDEYIPMYWNNMISCGLVEGKMNMLPVN